MRGGKRPGAGRPKGSRSVNTLVREAQEQGLDTADTSLDYLQKVYRGRIRNPDPKRIEAARAAAPYEFPRLTEATITQRMELEGKSEEEIQAALLGQLAAMMAMPEWRAALIKLSKEHLGLVEATETSDKVVPLRVA